MQFNQIGYCLGNTRIDLKTKYKNDTSNPYSNFIDKTGIEEVYHSVGETIVDLALKASKNIEFSPEKIDTMILVTQSNSSRLPTLSTKVAKSLKLADTTRLIDLNHGCSGYVIALEIANTLFVSGASQKLLIITCDTYSKFLDERSLTTSVLFSDAACVTYLTSDGSFQIKKSYAYGKHEEISSLEIKQNFKFDDQPDGHRLSMNGPAVYSFARSNVKRAISTIFESTNLTKDDVDLFIFHQASGLILRSIINDSNIPLNKAPTYLPKIGNTTSSSIPILIKLNFAKFNSSAVIFICGFGVGLHVNALLFSKEK